MREQLTFRSLTESVNTPAIFVSHTRLLPPLPDTPRRLPHSIRRCPDFDNDCPESEYRRPVFKNCCSKSKTFRAALVNVRPERNHRRPERQSGCPGWVNGCSGGFRLCHGFQTLAPFLKAFAPISGTPRLFCKLLPQSYLQELPQRNAKNARKPSPVLSDTLSHRMGEGRGEGLFNFQPSTPNYQPT
jgi:hypothetical protein